jgi:predicted nucleic acid-binding protein
VIAFLDANALIYLTEGRKPFAERARAGLASLAASQAALRMAVSRLTWLECRVGPLKQGDTGLLARYDTYFAQPDLLWVELDSQVVELATHIRARHGLRTPDALQAACCLQLGPTHLLLTGDAAFQRVPGLTVRLLA